jgi:hypothetical protein
MIDLLKNIYDPEFPNTLEELKVINIEDIIIIKENKNYKAIIIYWIPTVAICSYASHIGLAIR